MWPCGKCGTDGNYATRKKCRSCQEPRPDDVARPWKKGGSSRGSSSAGSSAATDALSKQLKEKNAEIARLKKEAKDSKAATEGPQVEEGPAAQLARLRETLKGLEKLPEGDGFGPAVERTKQKIDVLVKQLRESKPHAVQLKELEDKLAKTAKEYEGCQAKHTKALEEAQGHAARAAELELERASLERQKQALLSTAAGGTCATPHQKANLFAHHIQQAIGLLEGGDDSAKPLQAALQPMEEMAKQYVAAHAAQVAAGAAPVGGAGNGQGGGNGPAAGGVGARAEDVVPTQRYVAGGALLGDGSAGAGTLARGSADELSPGDIDMDSDLVKGMFAEGADETKRSAAIAGMLNQELAKRRGAFQPS